MLTGTPDADGNPHGLSHTQALALVDLYLDMATVGLMPRPAPDTGHALAPAPPGGQHSDDSEERESMYLVTTDAQLGAVVVAPAYADVVDDKARTAIDSAGFVWNPEIEAYTKPGQDRAEAVQIAGLLFALGYAVRTR
ncbi:hypothetical protein [Streptomyces mirabilis]|uniref:hypothetical protein n=1 Tax=Streptomyces mirabilis TaxID=68239 RepID=UPI00224EBE06|nr:hypothetical protein [Streptomyces mirabilis]MCX4430209.1 hypothetical protein [Streptomyces mirabilis]